MKTRPIASSTSHLGLTLAAWFGDIALTAALLLPILLPALIAAVLIDSALLRYSTALCTLILAWAVYPGRHQVALGAPLGDIPALRADIESLRQQLGVAHTLDIRLTDELNAGASEQMHLLGLGPARGQLYLGIPLLALLSREQMLAVIAHELGHFSRRHGSRGHTIYRTRAAWHHYLQRFDRSGSRFQRAVSWWAQGYVRWFDGKTLALSRACEYEADADAAHSVGAVPLGQALIRIHAAASLAAQTHEQLLQTLIAEHASPANDGYQQWLAAMRDALPKRCADAQAALQKTCAQLAQVPQGGASQQAAVADDTHPPVPDRLTAVGLALDDPRLIDATGASAAESWWGPGWADVVTDANQRWAAAERADWTLRHLLETRRDAPLRALAADEVSTLPVAQQIAWVAAQHPQGSVAQVQALLALQARQVQTPHAGLSADDDDALSFAIGTAELALAEHQAQDLTVNTTSAAAPRALPSTSQSAIDRLEKLAKTAPCYRAAIFGSVADHLALMGHKEASTTWRTWHRQHWVPLQGLMQQTLDTFDHSEGKTWLVGKAPPSMSPCPLTEATREVLKAWLSQQTGVQRAWLAPLLLHVGHTKARGDAWATLHLLTVELNPTELDALNSNEDRFCADTSRTLWQIIPPHDLVIVRGSFSTEKPPMGCRGDGEVWRLV